MNIILIGYRGCGKSGVGEILADRLNYSFVDCDLVFTERVQMSISAYVALKGWDDFRKAETEILRELLQHENQIIATGGGIVVSPEARELLKKQPFVAWLTVSYENIVNRIKADESSRSMRPPLGSYKSLADEVQVTLTERLPLYAVCSGFAVSTDLLTPEQATDEILQAWHLIPTKF